MAGIERRANVVWEGGLVHGRAMALSHVLNEAAGRVPGMDAREFERLAQEAERSCAISNALRGNLDVRVNASLETKEAGCARPRRSG